MSRKSISSIHAQKGNVYIVAIFVIVVMGMLSLNLTRISWSNQDTLTREVLGTQASFLAQSGNEWALTQLFPLDEEDDFNSLSARCGTLGASANDAGAALVSNGDIPCTVPTIECTAPTSGVPDELRYIKVSTQATCSDGSVFEVEREETVWVRGVKDE